MNTVEYNVRRTRNIQNQENNNIYSETNREPIEGGQNKNTQKQNED